MSNLLPETAILTPEQLKVKKTVKKIVALALLITPIFHIVLTAREILVVFPQISFVGNAQTANQIYLDLLKKGITISLSLIIDTFYGFSLFLKPIPATKTIHIVLGVILFLISNVLFHFSGIDKILSHIQFLPVT